MTESHGPKSSEQSSVTAYELIKFQKNSLETPISAWLFLTLPIMLEVKSVLKTKQKETCGFLCAIGISHFGMPYFVLVHVIVYYICEPLDEGR